MLCSIYIICFIIPEKPHKGRVESGAHQMDPLMGSWSSRVFIFIAIEISKVLFFLFFLHFDLLF